VSIGRIQNQPLTTPLTDADKIKIYQVSVRQWLNAMHPSLDSSDYRLFSKQKIFPLNVCSLMN
jgi:hypothetical protein